MCLLGCVAHVQAETEVGSQVLNAGDYVGQLVFSLGVVLALIFAAAWLLKRFTQLPGGRQQHIQIISAMAVGRQEKLLLVQVGQQQMLIGVTSAKITLLQTLAEPVAVADNEAHEDAGMPFSKWFNDALKKAPKR